MTKEFERMKDTWRTLRGIERAIAFKVMADRELGGNFLSWMEAYIAGDWPDRDAFADLFAEKIKQADSLEFGEIEYIEVGA